MATGEYLLFCDSDDEFLEGALATIRDRIAESRPDKLIFGFIRRGGPLDGVVFTLPEGKFENSGYAYAETLPEQATLLQRLSGDAPHCEKIAVINVLLYFYRDTPGSLSKRSDAKHCVCSLKMDQKWHRKLSNSKIYPRLAQCFAHCFCVRLNSFGMYSKAEKLQAFGLSRDNPMIFKDVAGFKLKAAVVIWRILGLNLGTVMTSRFHSAMIKFRKYL